MSEFTTELWNKASELFPYLQHIDLLPFFLNSHAVSAYDAVMLIEKSTKSLAYDSLDPCLIVCYLCQIIKRRIVYFA